MLTTEQALDARQSLTLFAGYALANCLTGLAFWLVCRQLTAAPIDPIVAVGAFSLAGAAGVAVIFFPSGIGVREAVLVALLSGIVPAEDALLAGATIRALSILADVLPLVFMFSTRVLHRLSHAPALRSLKRRGFQVAFYNTARPEFLADTLG